MEVILCAARERPCRDCEFATARFVCSVWLCVEIYVVKIRFAFVICRNDSLLRPSRLHCNAAFLLACRHKKCCQMGPVVSKLQHPVASLDLRRVFLLRHGLWTLCCVIAN